MPYKLCMHKEGNITKLQCSMKALKAQKLRLQVQLSWTDLHLIISSGNVCAFELKVNPRIVFLSRCLGSCAGMASAVYNS